MAILKFQELSFKEKEDFLEITFLKIYKSKISINDLKKIGNYEINSHEIDFKDVLEHKAQHQFNFLLSKSFNNLKNTITGKDTVYIHKNSGIPLIGNVAFGIVDRNTNLIEIKPITSCNIECIYCSVNQDRRAVEFVVEDEYMIEEIKKLVLYKDDDEIEIHIGTQGEPLLYSNLTNLIKGISKIPKVKKISIDTNGTLITKDKADELIKAGLTQFNLSLNAMTQKTAEEVAGCPYKIDKTIELARYIANTKADLMITPVYIPGINDKEIPKLIEFSKEIECKIGIQNFLNYKFGKNPVKQISWDDFYIKLKKLEKEFSKKLILSQEDFNIHKTKSLKKPFKKNDIIKARLVCKGRMKGEMIAVALGRNITVNDCNTKKMTEIKVKITRDKHNIFYAMKV